jgi:putative ABC transport system permease protein
MKILDIVLTANRNLMRSKLRTLFTILAIFVGGFTLTLTTALNTGANEYLQRRQPAGYWWRAGIRPQ